MQVRLLIGRYAGDVVEMAYDRAVANRELGHVEFVGERPLQPQPLEQLMPVVRLGARPRGRPPGPRRPIGA